MHAVDIDDQGHAPRTDAADGFFLTEANHRIANNLALLAGAVKARGKDIAVRDRLMRPAEVNEFLDEVVGRINTVGALHRLLSGTNGDGIIDLGSYLDDVARTLVAAVAGEDRIDLVWTTEGACPVPSAEALPIALIIAEALTNAVKYAHPTGMAAKAWIGCTRRNDNSLLIDFRDDGIGLPEGFDPETDGGLGLRTMRGLAAQLGAQLLFRTGPLGFGVTLVVPPPARATRPRIELVT
ncbi:MAG: sensor histidine kinase [Bauldia sp.]|nr:sensor histidine kinase [Bauldia sp.]